MKSVIHDCDDAQALEILTNVRRASGPRSRVVLYETVVSRPNDKRFAKLLDVEMIVRVGGRERTRDECAEVLGRAGLRLSLVIATAGPASIIEAVVA